MHPLYLSLFALWQGALATPLPDLGSLVGDLEQDVGNAVSAVRSAVSPAACACAALALEAKDSSFQTTSNEVPPYITPASPLYASRVDAQWSDNCYQNASCIISPPTAKAVAEAMATISACKSPFAVRSGGHNFNVGFSNVGAQGVLIDLVNLNQTTLSGDKKTVAVGPGARWQSVYQTLAGSGVSVNGARAGLPGAGGSLLGGGFGYYMNAQGVSATGICAAEVVLANGSIVEASSTAYSDLWWAIKGGGPNYGIVTKYTLNTVAVDSTWYLVRLYPESSIPALIEAIANYTSLAEGDTTSNLYVSLNPSGSIVGFTNTGSISNPPIFAAFYDIPYEVELQPSTIGNEYTNTLAYTIPPSPPERQYGTSVAVKSNYQTFNQSYAAYLPVAQKLSALGGSLNLGFEIVNSNAAKQTAMNTPLGTQVLPQTWFAVTLSWPDPANDNTMFTSTDGLTQSLQQVAQANNGLLNFKFPNDANAKEAVLAGYGATNLAKLRSTSTKYDPGQVFQKQQNNGFLLSEA